MSSLRNRKQEAVETMTEAAAQTSGERLHFYSELPEWQKDNHYILSGYVRETSSYAKSFLSLFYLHNETVNIYSHLVPASVALGLIYYYISHKLVIYETFMFWETYNFLQFGAAATFCLCASSTFHCLKLHSYSVCKVGNQLDYFGIIVLTSCLLISIVLFAFYDEPKWKYFFVAIFVGLGSICTVLTLDKKFATPVYRPLRSLMFVLFGLLGLLPLVVAISKYGIDDAMARSSAQYLALEGLFYIGGAALYAMRVPERFFHHEEENDSLLRKTAKGPFDIFGHSHQIFHVMVVIAAYCHWFALLGCYHYLHQHILPGMAAKGR